MIDLLDDETKIVSLKVLEARYNVQSGSVGTIVLSNPGQSQTSDFIKVINALNKAVLTIDETNNSINITFDSSVSPVDQSNVQQLLAGITGLPSDKIALQSKSDLTQGF